MEGEGKRGKRRGKPLPSGPLFKSRLRVCMYETKRSIRLEGVSFFIRLFHHLLTSNFTHLPLSQPLQSVCQPCQSTLASLCYLFPFLLIQRRRLRLYLYVTDQRTPHYSGPRSFVRRKPDNSLVALPLLNMSEGPSGKDESRVQQRAIDTLSEQRK